VLPDSGLCPNQACFSLLAGTNIKISTGTSPLQPGFQSA